MIVSFFVLVNCLLGLLKDKFKGKVCQGNDKSDSVLFSDIRNLIFEGEAAFSEEGLRFFPPVYIQRYRAVVEVLNCQRLRGSIKKIVDFGCAEVSFFSYIKHLEGVEEYVGVDIDEETLRTNYCRVLPFTADYLSRRCSPLRVTILKGSVVNADVRLTNTDTVIAIELIEHMYPHELNDLPYNIFGVINPEVAVFTTPNSDFNVLFERLGFRHPDHKFEWSRSQFEDWANNLTVQYPDYAVLFHGIGKGPLGTEDVGCCSQMAVFIRKSDKRIASDDDYNEYYERIHGVEYPFQTTEQRLNDILEYEVYHSIKEFADNEDYLVGERMEIPLDVFIQRIRVQASFDQILDVLRKEQKEVEYINNKATLILPCYDLEEKSWHDNSNSDEIGSVSVCEELEVEPECWDLGEDFTSYDIMKSDESEERDDSAWNTDLPLTGNVPTHMGKVKKEGEGSDQPLLTFTNTDIPESNADDSKVKNAPVVTNEAILVKETPKFCSTGAISNLGDHGVSSRSSCSLGEIASFKRDLVLENTPANLFSTPECTESSMNGTVCTSGFSADTPGKLTIQTQSTPLHTTKSAYSSSIPMHNSGQAANASQVKSNGSKLGLESSLIKKTIHKELNVEKVSVEGLPDPEDQQCSGLAKEIATDEPCSSVQRSHSLENINVHNSKDKNFRYSLNIDNDQIDCDTRIVDMELEVYVKGSSVPSLTETFGSQSKAADSGYPNSAHDMEMDLTPEQVDEIITETESSLEDEESSGDERVAEPVQGNNAPVVFLDNVENGDVANNNRDGEGNNMEGGEVIEEIVGFEGMAGEGGDLEAGPHESDDEGLYLSALDVSNDTLVPDESCSHEAAFDSAFDLPSSSLFLRPYEVEDIPVLLPDEHLEFPPWLLAILVNDVHPASGDSVNEQGMPDRNSTSSSESIVNSNNELVEVIVPGDTMGGGEPSSCN